MGGLFIWANLYSTTVRCDHRVRLSFVPVSMCNCSSGPLLRAILEWPGIGVAWSRADWWIHHQAPMAHPCAAQVACQWQLCSILWSSTSLSTLFWCQLMNKGVLCPGENMLSIRGYIPQIFELTSDAQTWSCAPEVVDISAQSWSINEISIIWYENWSRITHICWVVLHHWGRHCLFNIVDTIIITILVLPRRG